MQINGQVCVNALGFLSPRSENFLVRFMDLWLNIDEVSADLITVTRNLSGTAVCPFHMKRLN